MFFADDVLTPNEDDCWVIKARNLTQLSVLLCEYSPVVKENFKSFGDIDILALSSKPVREDCGKVAALLLLTASASSKKQKFIEQILGFPESHQHTLQRVLKYALTDGHYGEHCADLTALKNMLVICDNFIEALTELADSKDREQDLEEQLRQFNADSRDQLDTIHDLKFLPSNLETEIRERDQKIASLEANLEDQELEFQEIMLELKEDMDSKDDLIRELQEGRTTEETAELNQKLERLVQKLEEAKTLNQSLIEELKGKEIEKEATSKFKGLLDYLNGQLEKEKLITEQLRFDVANLQDLLDSAYEINENLRQENKQLYNNTRKDARRVKHLSKTIEDLSTKREDFPEVFEEGESLNSFTIEHNKQMEADFVNYRNQIKTLELQLAKKEKKLMALQQKFQAFHENPSKLIEVTNINEHLQAENESLKATIENFGPAPKTFGRLSKLPSLEFQPLRVLSAEIFASSSKKSRADETSMLRERIKAQDDNISRLLCLKSSLLVSFETLNSANQALSSQKEELQEKLKVLEVKLAEAVQQKNGVSAQLDRELKFMSSILADVEKEVVGIRFRFANS